MSNIENKNYSAKRRKWWVRRAFRKERFAQNIRTRDLRLPAIARNRQSPAILGLLCMGRGHIRPAPLGQHIEALLTWLGHGPSFNEILGILFNIFRSLVIYFI